MRMDKGYAIYNERKEEHKNIHYLKRLKENRKLETMFGFWTMRTKHENQRNETYSGAMFQSSVVKLEFNNAILRAQHFDTQLWERGMIIKNAM